MIEVVCNTKAKATLRMSNLFSSYLFEQEYGELNQCTPSQKKTLRSALEVLNKIINNSK